MSGAAYDAFVSQLRHAGVAEDAAHRRAAMEYPDAAREKALEADRRDDVLEKDEQREIVKLFTAFRFKVRNLSQSRASKQAPGLPDLWCMHLELPIAFWWESKRQVRGRHSEAQIEFRDDCVRCGVGYGTGDRRAAQTHLIHLGLAYVDAAGVLEPIRRTA